MSSKYFINYALYNVYNVSKRDDISSIKKLVDLNKGVNSLFDCGIYLGSLVFQ